MDIEIIRVKLGEPFKVHPTFPAVEVRPDDLTHTEDFDLEIKGLGKGRLNFFRDTTVDDCILPTITPAGPIELKYMLDGDDRRLDPDTAPLEFEAEIYRVSQIKASRISFKYTFRGQVYQVNPYYYKSDKLLNFSAVIDPESGERSQAYFPPNNPSIFEEMDFVIDLNKS